MSLRALGYVGVGATDLTEWTRSGYRFARHADGGPKRVPSRFSAWTIASSA